MVGFKEKIKNIVFKTKNMDESTNQYIGEILGMINSKCNELSPKDAAKFIMELDNKLYLLEGNVSVRYGNGVHTKHKHIKYHDFFVQNINSGENVLDIGSSRGELTNDIAGEADPGQVYGIEIIESQFKEAEARYRRNNLHFILGDATKDELPAISFDVVTLSNVLEHIEQRVEFLRILKQKYNPKRFLIRVPMFERDWRVPFKKELGLDYRLDDTHFIEYTKEIFEEETSKAGLKIAKLDVRWGEIWAVLN